VARALDRPELQPLFERPARAIVAGKAAAPMAAALIRAERFGLREVVAVGTHQSTELPHSVEWITAAHPLPDRQSLEAGARALAIADRTEPGEVLLLLLSGGASSLLALPADGVSLDDKRIAIDRAIRGGANIQQLNAKAFVTDQGRAACRGLSRNDRDACHLRRRW
jgi:glycerate-2-kinase